MKEGFWRYSRWDAVLFAVAMLQLGSMVAWALSFASLSWQANAAIFIPMALVFYFNPIVIVHNFLHCPFFTSRRLNSLFAIVNSANLGLPQVLYKYHHHLHHRFSNDPIADGTTRDPSSTFRFGKAGRQENWALYSALSLFRDATTYSYAETMRHGQGKQLLVEALSAAAALALWLFIDWRFCLFVYVPLFYVGWFLAHVENYFEHFHATNPRDRFANSVSFYPRWYNAFMFNEGLHQAHHLEPGRHWTQRPIVQQKYQERIRAAGAYAAKFPPLLGWLDR